MSIEDDISRTVGLLQSTVILDVKSYHTATLGHLERGDYDPLHDYPALELSLQKNNISSCISFSAVSMIAEMTFRDLFAKRNIIKPQIYYTPHDGGKVRIFGEFIEYQKNPGLWILEEREHAIDDFWNSMLHEGALPYMNEYYYKRKFYIPELMASQYLLSTRSSWPVNIWNAYHLITKMAFKHAINPADYGYYANSWMRKWLDWHHPGHGLGRMPDPL